MPGQLEPKDASGQMDQVIGHGACTRADGFTLIELMATVAVIAVLLTIAVPSFIDLALNQSVRSGAADLQTTLYFARAQAITMARDVSVVPSGGDWKNGWTVQLSDGTALRREAALNSLLSSMSGSTVTYQSDGRVVPPLPGDVVFMVSGDSNVTARCVRLDLSGRPSLVVDTDGDPSNGCN